MSDFVGGRGSDMPIVLADNANNTATITSGITVQTISMVLFPFPCSGSGSSSRHRGKRNSEYRTIPTITAKMTAITIPVMMARLKIARAWGDSGLSALITSTPKKAALSGCTFMPSSPNRRHFGHRRRLQDADCAKRLQGLRGIISTVLIAHIGSNGDGLPLRDDPLTGAGIVIVVRCETESLPNGRAQTDSGVRIEHP